MMVELKHHYGWQIYNVPVAETLEEAAYKAVRSSHDFLRDDNHTHDAGEKTLEWGGQEIRFKSVRIFRNAVSERESPYSGPPALETDYWFAVEYKQP